MTVAMEAVMKGSKTNRAAKLHGVPCTTLKDRLSGRVRHGSRPGPKPCLDDQEDHALAEHLEQAAEVSYGKTRKQVKAIVDSVAREKQVLRSPVVTDGWWRRFVEREPQLALRHGDATVQIRIGSTYKVVVEGYFNLLESTLKHYNSGVLRTGIPYCTIIYMSY